MIQTDVTVPIADDEGAGAAAIAPGGRLGRFVIEGALGAGGVGVVMAAFDPELDRKVAIKVLRAGFGAGVEARARLQREAQAMARLAHPNAVTVYEVGRAGDNLFIAMELVDGTTLRGWLSAQPRTWREIVAMFVAAGRGLEAAHAAGLVHRDFKPENVLIGRDGRPRVSDFGLAESGVRPEREEVERADPDASLALRGVAVGTPSHMAPEQWRGDEVVAATDQFAFCVALWTALWQQPPFAGDDVAGLRAAVLAGTRRSPPPAGEVPAWIAPILDRGLAPAVGDRWPSLTALLGELERRLGGRRGWWLGAGAAAAVIGAGVVTAIALAGERRPVATPDPCPAPTATIAAVWDAAHQQALRDHALAIDPDHGARRFAAAARVIDRGAAAYTAMFVDACRATRVEGRQSDTVLDLRMKCLAQWRTALDYALDHLGHAADPPALLAAVEGARPLGELDGCADGDALLAKRERKSPPRDRGEADAIIAEIQTLIGEMSTGDPIEVNRRAAAAVERARALGHDEVLSNALAVRWRVAFVTGHTHEAVAIMREAVIVASRSHNDEEAAKTWATMARISALYDGHPESAQSMLDAARAASARIGSPPLLEADILGEEADVRNGTGDTEGARAALARARSVYLGAGADQPGSPLAGQLAGLLQTEGEAAHADGDLDQATARFREGIAIFDDAYGPDTPQAAGLYLDLAQALRDQRRFADALAAVDQTVRVRGAGGSSAGLAVALAVRAAILADLDRDAEALVEGERAQAMAAAELAPEDAERLAVGGDLAAVYDHAGRYRDEIALYTDLLAAAERGHVVNLNVASFWLERGQARRKLGQCAAALGDFDRAVAAATEADSERNHLVGEAQRARAACEATLRTK